MVVTKAAKLAVMSRLENFSTAFAPSASDVLA